MSGGTEQVQLYAINRTLLFLKGEAAFQSYTIYHSFLVFGSSEKWIDLTSEYENATLDLRIEQSSSSNLGSALMSVKERILMGRDRSDDLYILILLSDGFYTDDFQAGLKELNEALSAPWRKYCIALSIDVNYGTLLSFVENEPERILDSYHIESIFSDVLSV